MLYQQAYKGMYSAKNQLMTLFFGVKLTPSVTILKCHCWFLITLCKHTEQCFNSLYLSSENKRFVCGQLTVTNVYNS